MLSSISSSLSLLQAVQVRRNVSAHNTANLQTEGFKKSRVDFQEAPGGGVRPSVSRVETPGVPLPPTQGTGTLGEGSNVNLVEEMTGMLVSEKMTQAAVTVIRSEDDRLGTLLDIVA